MRRGWLIYSMRRYFSFFLCGLLLLLSACQRQVETLHLNGATMGTTWSVALHSLPDSVDPVELKLQLQAQLDQINRLMSTYDPDSEISRFNAHNSSDWFPLSAETADVIELSLLISRLTGGAFDISVGPLVELWGFGASERRQQLPTDEQVAEQLAKVGYQSLKIRQSPAAVRKQKPLLRIDLSAVGKGYAVDLLAEMLNRRKIGNYLVEVGGELRIAGKRNDATLWKIAIEKPLEGVREVKTIFPLTDIGLATSGNYRNFYVENGQRYSHTIDPISGQPIRHKLASVTVLDPDCARADALATALMVLGEEKGRILVEQNRIAAYFLIHQDESFIEYSSPAFESFLRQVQL